MHALLFISLVTNLFFASPAELSGEAFSSLSAHRGRDVSCLYKPKSEVRLPFLGTVWCELTPPAGLSETQRLRVSVSSL